MVVIKHQNQLRKVDISSVDKKSNRFMINNADTRICKLKTYMIIQNTLEYTLKLFEYTVLQIALYWYYKT